MTIKNIYLILSFSLVTTFFSLPSNAQRPLAEVLADKNFDELQKDISLYDKDEIKNALEWLDLQKQTLIWVMRAKAILNKELKNREKEDREVGLPLGGDNSRKETSGGGGGSGGGNNGDGPFYGSGSSPSAFTYRPATRPDADLREIVSNTISKALGLPALNDNQSAIQVPSIDRMISFQPMHFLTEALKKLQSVSLKAEIQAFLDDQNRDHSKTLNLCWRALVKLKAEINTNKKLSELPYVYVTMAKLLLSTGMPPAFEISSEVKIQIGDAKEIYNRLNSYLRARIAKFCIRKWSFIYHALLNMEVVKRNPGREKNAHRIVEAYNFLQKAKKLGTTKSVHAFLSHLYLEHGQILGFDQQEIDDLVAKELTSFYAPKSPESEKRKKDKVEKAAPSFWCDVAQPPYYRDEAVQEDVRLLHEQLASHQIASQHEAEELPAVAVNQLPQQEASTLPARKIDRRYLLAQLQNYLFQGQEFTHYDVSGFNFRCFFNAVGLDADEQIELLLQAADDPRARAMIANEIVSAWRSFYQLPQAVRLQLNVRDLLERQARVDRLVASERQQELRDELQSEQDAILAQLRSRASTVEIFRAFVEHQIGSRIDGAEGNPYPMMVTQQDVRGEGAEVGNALPNLGAIDAIMLVNGIGLRVLQVHGRDVRELHSFIPENAFEISHVILSPQAQHFMALVPADNEMDVEEKPNHEELDAQIQAAYEEAAETGSITEKLSSLLQERFPSVIKKCQNHDEDEVRLILFLKSQGKVMREIREQPLITLSKTGIGDALVTNDVRSQVVFDDETIDQIFDVYLSTGFFGLKGPGFGPKAIAELIAKHYKLNQGEVQTFLKASGRNRWKWKDRKLTSDERSQIVSLYTDDPRFTQINAETGYPYLLILEVLTEDLAKDLRPKVFDPSVLPEKPQDRNKKIIDAFHSLTKENGKTPSAKKVAEHTGYSHRHTLDALMEAGLMKAGTKSKSLSEKSIESIRAAWKDRKSNGLLKAKEYEEIAKQVGASPYQVKELLEKKRKSNVSASDIQAAFTDLSAEEKRNPLPVLIRQFNCTEREIIEALKAIGVNIERQNGSKKPRKG